MTRDATASLIGATDDAPEIEFTPIERGSDVTLEAAIRAGDLAAATDLVRSGLAVNRYAPEGLKPLMIACGLGQSQMVDLLLTAGADPQARTPSGMTAADLARARSNAEAIQLLPKSD